MKVKCKEINEIAEPIYEKYHVNNELRWDLLLPIIQQLIEDDTYDKEDNLESLTIGMTGKEPLFKLSQQVNKGNIEDILAILRIISDAAELIKHYLAQKEELTLLRKKLEESQNHLNALATALNTAVSVFESKES